MTLQGRVENGVVVFENGTGTNPLPDGTLVEVTPVRSRVSNPPALPAALGTAPEFSPEEVIEFERAVAEGRISKERQQAVLGLIGMWKVEHPPNDEEVQRIIEEERR
jgi:hypothetical protein